MDGAAVQRGRAACLLGRALLTAAPTGHSGAADPLAGELPGRQIIPPHDSRQNAPGPPPPTAQSPKHEPSVLVWVRRYGTLRVPVAVAPRAGCRDVLANVAATISPRVQMLGRAAVGVSLPSRQAMALGERFGIAEPHGLGAVTAQAMLTLEGGRPGGDKSFLHKGLQS